MSFHVLSNRKQVTNSDFRQWLLLDGKDGAVACRVYEDPEQFVSSRMFQMLTHTYWQMKNLQAVRGRRHASMIGPLAALGSLNDIHLYRYTIEIKESIPIFFQTPKLPSDDGKLSPVLPMPLGTKVHAIWQSGRNDEITDNLFSRSGTLRLYSPRSILKVAWVDATQIDLSTFQAQLMKNDERFAISHVPIDDFRVVTYLYETEYHQRQVQEGCGLFLEKHQFSQLILPLNDNSDGYITLGKYNSPLELELIAFRIPFGWSLLVGEGSIHGDSTLRGHYGMCMTSDHTTMATADTVFLKHGDSQINVDMVPDPPRPEEREIADSEQVLYWNATTKEKNKFCEHLAGRHVILQPLSRAYWTYLWHKITSS